MATVKGEVAGFNVDELFSAESTDKLNIGGFPPYYNPTEGEIIHCVPIGIDARDPEFIRYVCIALRPIMCATGSKKQGLDVPVEVSPGERFCISNYVSLPLDQLIGDPAIPVQITVGDKVSVQSDSRKDRWNFSIEVPKKFTQLAKLRAAQYVPSLPARKAARVDDSNGKDMTAGGRL
jgi:hypothetical protein